MFITLNQAFGCLDNGVTIFHQGVDVEQLLSSRGLNQVCAKIDLGQYQEGEDTEYLIKENDLEAKKLLTNKEIRLAILDVLYRIKRMVGMRSTLEPFNVDGFCEILGIDTSGYLLNASYLCEKGYAADSPIQQFTREKGGIYITAEGIDYLEDGGNISSTPNINTGGGPYVGGNLDTGGGDFTSRDKIAIDQNTRNRQYEIALEWEKNDIKPRMRWFNLAKRDLSELNLVGADLKGANLAGADLMDTNLRGAILTDADLTAVRYNDATRWPDGFTPPDTAIKVD